MSLSEGFCCINIAYRPLELNIFLQLGANSLSHERHAENDGCSVFLSCFCFRPPAMDCSLDPAKTSPFTAAV